MHFKHKLSLALLLLTISTIAQAERRERLIDAWRPVHYEVSLAFDDKLSELTKASTEITVLVLKDSVTAIDLDFGEMSVDSVRVGGVPAKYSQSGGKLVVTFSQIPKRDEQLKISVAYHGRPKDGLILINDKDGKPSATGDNWPDRVHNWIPCLDHPSAKATVRFTVNAPARDVVVANGQLESTRPNSNKMQTWIWNESVPISPYCMIICAGEFARLEAKDKTVTPLSYYVPQSDRKFAMQGFAPAAPSLKLFTETVAPYPYEKLGLIVGATRYGGMENSSAIVFASTLFKNFETPGQRSRTYNIPGNVERVVAHEIAHQWFGDSVTEATWADLWLSEGFATYFAGLFIERNEGEGEFRAYMKDAATKYFGYEKERKTPIHDLETENLNDLLNANNYEKGAWVLHMLRGMLGDKAFFEGIRDYYASHRNSTATTEDLRAALEKSSGMSLKDFFARWVYASGHPIYEATWSYSNGFIEIALRQTQEDGTPFLIPLTVELVSPDGTQRVTIKPDSKNFSTRIPLAHPPTDVRIDPDDFVLKEITVKQQ
ncbi:MAG TPA: M1 family metallopeptidase [Pyrinomonadaceae bacterium]|jgi:aminopeptidase N